MKKYFTLLFTLVFLAGFSCTDQPGKDTETNLDYEADKQALKKISSEWDANALAGNMEANLDFFTNKAVRIQNGMIYTGKEEIQTLLTNEIRPGFTTSSSENTVEDIRISGDLATVSGTFIGSWAHQEWGDTLWTKLAWVDVLERQDDGSWKMVFNMGTELRE